MLATFLALAVAQSSPTLFFEPTFDPTTVAVADRLRSPTDIAAIPGDDRIFVTQQDAKIRIIRDGELLQQPFADLAFQIPFDANGGLLALTFHPSFDVNGFAYIWYADRDLNTQRRSTVLARITVDSSDPDLADLTSLVEILRVPVDSLIHLGGRMAFGPDGMLWIGIGDGGGAPVPGCSSQDMTRLAGKMIRIDVDAGFPYVVPPDNPFIGVPGVAPEIVHSGLRHPWKWTFDGATGDLWIGEIGSLYREEVNFAPAGVFGLNYGWPAEEGSLCFDVSACSASIPACGDSSYTAPAFEYPHGAFGDPEGECAVTGGEVYYGSAVPWLVGWYLCADLCTNQMWRIRRTPLGTFEVRELPVVFESPPSPGAWSSLSFGIDGFGELLFLDFASFGMVRRLRGACTAVTTCDGAPNAAGTAAEIRWGGSTSLEANDALVIVTDLPASSPTLLFYGPLTDLIAVGNGSLCVGGPLSRVSVDVADGTGRSQFDLDFTAPPFSVGPGEIELGSTWTFQAWYRDIGGPLGSTYNFSGATTVTFCP